MAIKKDKDGITGDISRIKDNLKSKPKAVISKVLDESVKAVKPELPKSGLSPSERISRAKKGSGREKYFTKPLSDTVKRTLNQHLDPLTFAGELYLDAMNGWRNVFTSKGTKYIQKQNYMETIDEKLDKILDKINDEIDKEVVGR